MAINRLTTNDPGGLSNDCWRHRSRLVGHPDVDFGESGVERPRHQLGRWRQEGALILRGRPVAVKRRHLELEDELPSKLNHS